MKIVEINSPLLSYLLRRWRLHRLRALWRSMAPGIPHAYIWHAIQQLERELKVTYISPQSQLLAWARQPIFKESTT